MDARLKYRHLRPADTHILNDEISKINKSNIAIEKKLSCLEKSRMCLHESQMSRIHFAIWLNAWRKLQDLFQNVQSDLQSTVYKSPDLNSFNWTDSELSLSQIVELQSQDFDIFVRDIIFPLYTI